MANEMFTNRSGRQVPVVSITLTPSTVVSLMRLQEDYQERGEHLSMLGVVLDVIDKGTRQVRNQWKNGDLSKSRRDFAKAVAPYMSNPAKYAVEIQQLAKVHHLVNGNVVDLSSPESEELTEEQLEETTAPKA